ncbi:hypothetical protein D9756_011216 [Leucocoprinus leucothites]|uniref:Copper-fist domain-containing protein n=1 Tax=Leucocoprinus leucothites TaxID=201217 RepID=A0A8H5CPU8_9AGAR|nr:hypothetical protein D9756_011216 [Leucoagaricus leucothites]
MVFIESKKYACETCIKGHRSSACKHTDRPLFEIKKKGRPVTQCEHCRELRKTKQVHVKCICEIKSDVRQVGSKASESAAFPNGIPQGLALEASVAPNEPTQSGGGGAQRSCCCVTGEKCQCWTPRKSAPRPRRKTEPTARTPVVIAPPAATTPTATTVTSEEDTATPHAQTSHILARISELRPVLPRPFPHHDPSLGVTHNRHHHENAFFSPYGRAYDINHPHHIPHTADDVVNRRLTLTGSKPQQANLASSTQNISPSPPPNPPSTSTATTATNVTFPSPCGCGDGCSCPGCFHHNNAPFAPSPTAYPTCQNPSACHACLDCTILSLPPDTALSIPEPQQAEVIDEWIRQMSSSNNNNLAGGGWDPNGNSSNSNNNISPQRQPCATCTSFFCTCEKREASSSPVAGDHHPHEAAAPRNCCDKPRLSPPPPTMMVTSTSSDFFDYTMLGSMQPSTTTTNDAGFMDAVDPFRSRSPSVSPQSAHDEESLSTQLFGGPGFLYSTPDFVDKIPVPQQSMYINGRGFYSDPYLSLSSPGGGGGGGHESQTHSGFTPFLPPPPTAATLLQTPMDFDYDFVYQHQQMEDAAVTAAGGGGPGEIRTYAVSNPDSDTSSSFDSSVDENSLIGGWCWWWQQWRRCITLVRVQQGYCQA